jgi:hypothetical protein
MRLDIHDSVVETLPVTSSIVDLGPSPQKNGSIKGELANVTRGLFQRNQEAWFKVQLLNAKLKMISIDKKHSTACLPGPSVSMPTVDRRRVRIRI